MTYKVERL